MLTSRLAICLSFLFCVSATLSAQDPKIFDGPKLSPVISAATPGDRVRFSSPSAGIAQMRVRIVYASGDVLFDSAWKDGNVLDWPIEAQGQPLTSGSYRCIVMVKDLAGQVTQKESTLIAQGGQVSFEHRAGTDGLTIVGVDEGTPKITVLVHDGDNGAIVSTSGGLSFRFGNFLAGKDREAMRLTADGSLGIGTDKPQAPLDVNGFIRTSKGIMFPDGSILTTAGAQAATGTGAVNRLSPNAPGSTTSGPILGLQTGASPRRPTPRGDFTPLLPQFVVDDNGVHIGNPSTSTYGLAVAGDVNLFHNLALPLTTPTTGVITLAGSPFAHAYGGNTFVGPNAGNLTMNTLLADANTAVGNHAFFGNVSGNFNTATGANALYSNSTGGANTGIGYGALNTNNADYNTAFGYNTLFANVSGSENTAVGRSALEHSTSSNNTARLIRAEFRHERHEQHGRRLQRTRL